MSGLFAKTPLVDRAAAMNRALVAAFDRFPMAVESEYGEAQSMHGLRSLIWARVGQYDEVRLDESHEHHIQDPRDGLLKMLQRAVDRVWYVNDCREAIRDLVDQ